MKNLFVLTTILISFILSGFTCNGFSSEITSDSNEIIINNQNKIVSTNIVYEKIESSNEKPKELKEVIPEIKITETETYVDKEKTSDTEESLLYTEEELYIMSHLIMGEAEGESWEHKIGVGSVVLNRVKDDRFPDTIKDVVFQEGQYACTWDGNYDKEPNEESIEAAKYLLENGSQFPEYVIFQAEFHQGDRVYDKIGNTYFCYYKKDVE